MMAAMLAPSDTECLGFVECVSLVEKVRVLSVLKIPNAFLGRCAEAEALILASEANARLSVRFRRPSPHPPGRTYVTGFANHTQHRTATTCYTLPLSVMNETHNLTMFCVSAQGSLQTPVSSTTWRSFSAAAANSQAAGSSIRSVQASNRSTRLLSSRGLSSTPVQEQGAAGIQTDTDSTSDGQKASGLFSSGVGVPKLATELADHLQSLGSPTPLAHLQPGELAVQGFIAPLLVLRRVHHEFLARG